MIDVLKHNREAWNQEVQKGNIWTIPVNSTAIEDARRGKIDLLLTPTKKVPEAWLPDVRGKNVLCLASGGGQQGPVFAAAGANVVVFDNCPAQLEKDLQVARRDNLVVKTEQGDMRDLSRFTDESFDLIFHPVSNCFVDNVKVVWKECYRVLKKDGVLLSAFANPITYIFDMKEWDNNGSLIVRYKIPYSDIEQLSQEDLDERIKSKEPLEFGHSLEDQIGGQILAGFAIAGFYEDSSGGDLLDKHIDTFIATKATK